MILFGMAFIGFIGSSLALFSWIVPHDLWRPLAIVSAIISLIALGLFWNAFVSFFPNKVGSIAVNITTLVCLLWLNWPSEAAIGY